ncbi:MAG: polysaccharide deacetylase [Gordonia sp.]|uniref:Polysaccharide deacetylase n=1 Tax=Gordonia rubripertincta TaxID=36822 RepID=A0ABT4MV25_GORRU|nr:polysaccharide deacetylase [Gordonia rubripertincta]MBA4021026.1 polysaccharide deacetylase [Gordonia sp. (in: high G+C Gram-positive bacteria)]MCZ4550859.1 polysaccharide deacetylase [Gordonia rubripertincta]
MVMALTAATLAACGAERPEVLLGITQANQTIETSDPPPEKKDDSGPQRTAGNVPMEVLAPGEKPPQFVLFSFDGVGVSENWDLFLETAKSSDSRFTALMTGLYFLADDHKKEYQGPGYQPGESSLAFGGSKAEVVEQVEYLNRTWYDGHEMGTHYVGHFCAGTKNPGKDWSTAEWNHELDQFFRLMTDWKSINNLPDAPDLAFGADVVKGGRTPCLEGGMGQLFPALGQHNMTWDSSKSARQPGIYWPTKVGSIWEFPIPYTWSPPLNHRQTALDYNYWYTFNQAKDAPGKAPQIRKIVKESYDYMFMRAYEGNRAPLVIANHFNDWSGNAFNPATADFMSEVCVKPETICATYQDVIAWMELQDPQVLGVWEDMPPVAVDADS